MVKLVVPQRTKAGEVFWALAPEFSPSRTDLKKVGASQVISVVDVALLRILVFSLARLPTRGFRCNDDTNRPSRQKALRC